MFGSLENLYGPLPLTTYMVSKGAGRRPLEYIGEWPKRGRAYQCELLYDENGEEVVRVLGLIANPPHSFFKRWRFRMVAEVWLN